MQGKRCFRCDRYLPPGNLKYVVEIKVYADFDGVLSITGEDLEGEMERILSEIEWQNVEDLENDVYQEIGLLLCKPCRDKFIRETGVTYQPQDNGIMIQ